MHSHKSIKVLVCLDRLLDASKAIASSAKYNGNLKIVSSNFNKIEWKVYANDHKTVLILVQFVLKLIIIIFIMIKLNKCYVILKSKFKKILS